MRCATQGWRRRAGGDVGQDDVDEVGLHEPQHLPEGARADHDLHVVAAEERLQEAELEVPGERGERPHPEHLALAPALAQGALQLGAAGEDGVGVVEGDAAGHGEHELLPPPVEQGVPELRLQLLDLHGDRRLRDVQARRGPSEVVRVRDRPEVVEVVVVEHRAAILFHRTISSIQSIGSKVGAAPFFVQRNLIMELETASN
jgi:hypothetical protein